MITDGLVKKFIKDYDNTRDTEVRGAYGTLSSVVGIICNILLFVVKYIMGVLSGSIAITSDAFNNLSDAASCIVTLFGYRLAAKPADKDHPFGHGRIEYFISLIISVVIMMVGFELLKSSFDKILHPADIQVSWVVMVSLAISIAMKLWMSVFNNTLGKRVDSAAMLATAQDSRNDVVATGATLLSMIIVFAFNVNIDGYIGVIVSLIVLKAGYEIIAGTLDELLGKPADAEIVDEIKALIKGYDRILGIHDMVIHNYGPGNQFGSLHAEIRSDENLMSIHDLIDRIEHEIYEKTKVIMTIHMDPIEVDNEVLNSTRKMVSDILLTLDEKLTMHDFRMVTGETHTNLIFDVLIPYESKLTEADIRAGLEAELAKEKVLYLLVITFDREFV